jgi:hypothetical protein
MSEPKVLKAGPVEIKKGAETPSRMATVIWGPATCGKTTFAATAPGEKLWFSFGDNEHISVAQRKDVHVADVSALDYNELFNHAQSQNPFGLDALLAENENIETVVVDSVTAIEYKALQKSVLGMQVGKGRGFIPTMEAPGISAYGGRNAIVLEVLTGFLRVTAKHNVHIIFTAHENDPVLTKEGTIDYYAIALGGKLINNVTWRLSEIWYMSQETTGNRNRKLAVRPTRLRRPMKSRMFNLKGDPEFIINYDSDKPDDGQMTIADFYYQWLDNNKQRIPVPSKMPEKKGK